MKADGDAGDRNFACTACGARQAGDGSCRSCGDDPVVDLRQPLTREVLVEQDERLRLRRADRVRYGSVPIGIVSVILLATFVPVLNRVFLALPFFAGYALSMIAIAVATMKAFDAFFPYAPMFPYAKER